MHFLRGLWRVDIAAACAMLEAGIEPATSHAGAIRHACGAQVMGGPIDQGVIQIGRLDYADQPGEFGGADQCKWLTQANARCLRQAPDTW